jgi:hypothetical protein
MQKKQTVIRSASADDSIYKEGWTVFTPQGFRAPSNANARETTPVKQPTGTGMDYRDQWADELLVIAECAPLTADEVKALDPQQLTDYFYVTSWLLRQEGEARFKAEREVMRNFFVGRIQRGEPLRPSDE